MDLLPLIFLIDKKMAELRRGLFTRYTCSGDISVRYPDPRYACFYDVSWRLKERRGLVHNKYTIWVFKPQEDGHYWGNRYETNPNYNATLLTKEELNAHVHAVQYLFPFKFKIEERDTHYEINLDVNQPEIYHRYLLSWIRYTYEYPFNVACFDMHQLRKLPECRFISTANLMLTTISLSDQPRIDHCIAPMGAPRGLKNKELKAKLNETNRLNQVYERVPRASMPDIICGYSASREEQLVSFANKKDKYLKFYKRIVKPR